MRGGGYVIDDEVGSPLPLPFSFGAFSPLFSTNGYLLQLLNKLKMALLQGYWQLWVCGCNDIEMICRS